LILGVLAVNETERLSAKVALTEFTKLESVLSATSPSTLSRFSSPTLSERHAVGVMSQFMAFHRSEKLQRAARTAVAMQLTDSQIHGLREQFKAIDANNDGHISREELEQAMMTLSTGETQEVPFGNVKSVFESVDTDGSGLIDYSEFCAAALKDGAVRCEKAMKAAFRVFDMDGDGHISKAELGHVLASQSEDLGEIDRLLDPWDADGDGQLSFDEFRAMVLNLGREMTSPGPLSSASITSIASLRAPAKALQEDQCRITSL
jgi:calcium-dependent protein kinase